MTASHTALRVRGCMRRDRSKAREVRALRGSSSFFLYLPHHLRPLFTSHTRSWPGRNGSPIIEGGPCRACEGGAPGFNSSQLPNRRCGETNWKFAQSRLGVVLVPDSLLFDFSFFFLLNELFKAMDLRERVSVWALVAGSCCRGDKRERMFGSSDGHSRWVSGLHAGAGEAFHAVCCV